MKRIRIIMMPDNSLKINEFLDKIINMDCILGMKEIPDNSIDLIIADPPYNLSKGNHLQWDNSVKLNGMGGNWNKVMESWDNLSLNEYWTFSYSWLAEAKRILKPTGSMWVFGTYHNIGIINVICQLLDIEIINEVAWYKRNAFPNLSGRRLTASHETILWMHVGGKQRKYYFNYEYSKNGLFDGDQLKNPGKQMRTVWDIPNNKDKSELGWCEHPTQKPLRVIDRIIKLTAQKGQIMLCPFSGSGSECVAAKQNGLHYIGFETDSTYCAASTDRLMATSEKENLIQLRLDLDSNNNDET
ncbi:MAG: site-specific DNA-methyltransferase [Roseburia sp.]|nr:site-specific DNA-methyltransferase [Roseburia sp.]